MATSVEAFYKVSRHLLAAMGVTEIIFSYHHSNAGHMTLGLPGGPKIVPSKYKDPDRIQHS